MSDVDRRRRSKELMWRAAFPRWAGAPEPAEGYSLLLPVPADLPVFLHLALLNAQFQEPEGRLETIVVPDIPSRAFREELARIAPGFAVGELRLVELDTRARAVRSITGTPGANHFVQFHAGAGAARGRRVLLHDADLFLSDPGFMRRHHERAAADDVACLGVAPAWDDWLREHALDHVVATWELMADVRWVRSFAPWRHRPHFERVDGEWHLFDLTLYPQALTPAGQCRIHDATESFEHFNYVISVYRHFQRASGPYEDYRFLLLLIRLLSDAHGLAVAGIPPVAGLVAGIEDAGLPVTYVDPPTAENYAEFRAQLRRITEGPVLGAPAAEAIEGAIEPFDRVFAA